MMDLHLPRPQVFPLSLHIINDSDHDELSESIPYSPTEKPFDKSYETNHRGHQPINRLMSLKSPTFPKPDHQIGTISSDSTNFSPTLKRPDTFSYLNQFLSPYSSSPRSIPNNRDSTGPLPQSGRRSWRQRCGSYVKSMYHQLHHQESCKDDELKGRMDHICLYDIPELQDVIKCVQEIAESNLIDR